MANFEQNETTRVFRMPSSDATAPDLMKSASLVVPVLSIIKGPQTGNVFEIDAPEITIGRDPANTIFLNDMTVSRSHARSAQRGGCPHRRPGVPQRHLG